MRRFARQRARYTAKMPAGILSAWLVLSSASSAHAAAPGGQDTPAMVAYDPPTERRGGFTMGAAFGAGLTAHAGYPNVADQIGDPAYLAASGPLFGYTATFWLGGALRDWLSVGLGVSAANAGAGATKSGITSGIVHLELYPLYGLGGHFRDLGFDVDAGLGGGALLQTSFDSQPIDAGATSHLAFSAHYEPWRFALFSAGPVLSYAQDFNITTQVSQVTLGLRFVLYTTQPREKPVRGGGTARAPRSSTQ